MAVQGGVVVLVRCGSSTLVVPLDLPVPGSNLGPGPPQRVVYRAVDRSDKTVQVN